MSPASRFIVEHRSKSQDLAVRKEYESLSFGAVKDLCKEEGLSAEGTRQAIVDRLAAGVLPASSPRLSVNPKRGDVAAPLDIKAGDSWRGGEMSGAAGVRQGIRASLDVSSQGICQFAADFDVAQSSSGMRLQMTECCFKQFGFSFDGLLVILGAEYGKLGDASVGAGGGGGDGTIEPAVA